MMTPSQRASLIRVARSCARQRSWGALVAWVETFDARPRHPTPQDDMKVADCYRKYLAGSVRSAQLPDTSLRRFLAWLR